MMRRRKRGGASKARAAAARERSECDQSSCLCECCSFTSLRVFHTARPPSTALGLTSPKSNSVKILAASTCPHDLLSLSDDAQPESRNDRAAYGREQRGTRGHGRVVLVHHRSHEHHHLAARANTGDERFVSEGRAHCG